MGADIVALASLDGIRFELDATSVVRRAPTSVTALALADVVRVRTAMLGGDAFMELHAKDGRKLIVLSHREVGRARGGGAASEEYRAFARELHHRLVALGHAVAFVCGLFLQRAYDPHAIPERWLP